MTLCRLGIRLATRAALMLGMCVVGAVALLTVVYCIPTGKIHDNVSTIVKTYEREGLHAFWASVAGYRRFGIMGCVFLCGAIFILNPISAALCLNYMSVFCISLVAVSTVLGYWEWLSEKMRFPLFFFLVGCLTSFADLLTFPLAALAFLPIVWIAIVRQHSFIHAFMVHKIFAVTVFCLLAIPFVLCPRDRQVQALEEKQEVRTPKTRAS